MAGIEHQWLDLRRLDDLSAGDTPVHRLDPLAKLLTTLVFILVTASFGKYDLLGLLPLVLYPAVLLSLGEIPAGFLFKRVLAAAPFAVLLGLFNPFFDRTPLVQIGSVGISGGWISFFSILIRFGLAVTAALLLMATTGLNQTGAALQRMGVPRVLVVQFLLLYRYINVLVEEASRVLLAYRLRAPETRGVEPAAWGSLAGQLLLRSVDRAQRVYQAMRCRGFAGEIKIMRSRRMETGDLLYFGGWTAFFLLVRLCNIPLLLGSLLTGVGR